MNLSSRSRVPLPRASVGRAAVAVLGLAAVGAFAPHARAQQLREVPATLDLPAAPGPVLAHALADVDGDGDLDLLTSGTGFVQMARNDGAGAWDVDAAATPAVVGTCTALALGDVDGDGDVDLVVGRDDPKHIPMQNATDLLWLNDGRGHFTDASAQLPGSSFATSTLLLFDADGDGDLDLAEGLRTTGSPPSTLRLYQNDGAGTFTDVTAMTVPASAGTGFVLAAADVDLDGDLDLATGERSLLLNDGSGVFTVGAGLPGTYGLVALAFGDDDRDGDPDLVGASEWGGTPGVPPNMGATFLYENAGGGLFFDRTVRLPAVAARPTEGVAFVDVDGDLDLDIVSAGPIGYPSTGPSDQAYRNDGSRGFVDATAAWLPASAVATAGPFVVGDQDGDGDLDLLGGGVRLRAYRSDGQRLRRVSRPSLEEPFLSFDALAAGDVNGDGHVDLLGSSDLVAGNWFAGDGFGGFTFAGGLGAASAGLELHDVDGDGDLDAVTAYFPKALVLLLNDGTGSFQDVTATHIPFTWPAVVHGFRGGDLDGDGDVDFVAAAGDGAHAIRNDGTGHFADVTATTLPANTPAAISTALGDVDGDGDLDLWLSASAGSDALYRNDGRGAFTAIAGAVPVLPVGSRRVAFGDLDGDGDADLVWCPAAGQDRCRILVNDGTGHFGDATMTLLPGAAIRAPGAALADFDGDGDLDVVLGASYPDAERLLVNDGTGVLHDAPARLAVAPSSWPAQQPVVTDFDGDGDPDLWLGREDGVLTNDARQIEVASLRSGGRLRVRISDRPGNAMAGDVAVPLLALATAATPLTIPGIGTLRLDPNGIVPLWPLAVPSPAGVVDWRVAVPANPWLVGHTVDLQGVIRAGASLSLTNAVEGEVER